MAMLVVKPLAITSPLAGLEQVDVEGLRLKVIASAQPRGSRRPTRSSSSTRLDLSMLRCCRGHPWLRTDPDGPARRTPSRTRCSSSRPSTARRPARRRQDRQHGQQLRRSPGGGGPRRQLGEHVAAVALAAVSTSITPPPANEGAVVKFLSERPDISPTRSATIGDMQTTSSCSLGLSIAMETPSRGPAGPRGRSPRRTTRTARPAVRRGGVDGGALTTDRSAGPRGREAAAFRYSAIRNPRSRIPILRGEELAMAARTPRCSSRWWASAAWAPGWPGGSCAERACASSATTWEPTRWTSRPTGRPREASCWTSPRTSKARATWVMVPAGDITNKPSPHSRKCWKPGNTIIDHGVPAA